MQFPKGSLAALAAVGVLGSALLLCALPAQAEPADPKLANDRCLRCHGREGFSREDAFGRERELHVSGERFEHSVHGAQDCVNCHVEIIKVPHRKGLHRMIGCVKCHVELWEEAKEAGTTAENARLGEVVEQIESYMGSMHARPSIDDQGHTNATCYDCHDAHYVEPIRREDRAGSHMNIPNVCGRCHDEVFATYRTSVHGEENAAGNPAAAVCSDCHATHGVAEPHDSEGRVDITHNCGNCHRDSLESYTGTYHGKVTRLGYGETAKCYDCHGSHEVQRLEHPASLMHVDNRLDTCRGCHEAATAGYVTFQPHGTTDDREKYPQMWFAWKFMIGLLIGTFSFFWLHSALWYFREYKDRKDGRNRPHVLTEGLPAGKTHIRRFSKWWRLAHLIGALSIMTLTLSGIGVLFAKSSWAPVVMGLLGGPETAGTIHRIGAIGFIGVFFVHLIYFAVRIGRNWRSFEWFGPNSLIPNWQDLKDATAMFRWFFGLGPRPSFDRFTYWEKFDYWAPFWGMTIIGISGVMMWFPDKTAAIFPGWVFNVSTIVHGEEAFLAAVFLFTVHFFNNHFRPDKFPQDITMFTGRVPVEIYRHEHRREYDRLVASGELESRLVQAPSAPMTRASRMLGGTLIIFGLTLLTLVILGFLGI
jgi:cytochrome b subunit of formate dehydrogenase